VEIATREMQFASPQGFIDAVQRAIA